MRGFERFHRWKVPADLRVSAFSVRSVNVKAAKSLWWISICSHFGLERDRHGRLFNVLSYTRPRQGLDLLATIMEFAISRGHIASRM